MEQANTPASFFPPRPHYKRQHIIHTDRAMLGRESRREIEQDRQGERGGGRECMCEREGRGEEIENREG